MDFASPRALLAGACLAAGIISIPAAADHGRTDHERARKALLAGEILPLPAILDRVEREVPGNVLEVELEQAEGRWVYELKVLRPGGSVVRLHVDGRDGAVLRRREAKR